MVKSRSIFSFIILLLFIGIKEANGQDRLIHGQVFDFSTKKPLPYVHALLYTADTSKVVQGGTTAIDGSFSFENLAKSFFRKLSTSESSMSPRTDSRSFSPSNILSSTFSIA